MDYRPHTEETNRTRLIMGGNLFYYAGYLSITKADITTSKLIININISTPGAR